MIPPRTSSFRFTTDYLEKNNYPFIPFDVPEIENKRFKIEHSLFPGGAKLDIINHRMMFLTGERLLKLQLDSPWICHKLIEKGHGVWISTIPVETYTQIYPAIHAHGKVLIGGLGLGYIIKMMSELNSSIKEIKCVELDKDVIDLMSPYVDNDIEIINKGIYEYLENTDEVFDYIYLDTWTDTGEWCLNNVVLPLRQIAKKRLKNNSNPHTDINCWMEEVMRGQIYSSIFSSVMFNVPPKDILSSDQYAEFNPINAIFFDKYKMSYLKSLEESELVNLVFDFVFKYEGNNDS